MVWPAIAAFASSAGGGAILGSLAGGALSYLGSRKQNEASAFQSAQQMDFQERMSNTAHQREVADLRKAGLNPILSGTGGAGASTPGGAQAPMVNEMSGLAETARAAAAQYQQVKLLKAQRKASDAKRRET